MKFVDVINLPEKDQEWMRRSPRRYTRLTGHPSPAEQLRDQIRSGSGATFIRGGIIKAFSHGAHAEVSNA